MSCVSPYAESLKRAQSEFPEKYIQDESPALKEEIPSFRLFTRQDIMNLPSIDWKVQGVFPESGFACIYGVSGGGKSFLAMDMALSMAEGRRWFGLRTKKDAVTYIVAEGQGGLKGRVIAWEQENKRELPGNVQFLLDDFYIGADVERLAKSIPTGSLIVIDTMNAVSAGLAENDVVDMGIIISNCKKLQKLTSGLVCLIHHCGKDAAKGLRGHTSLIAALDAAIEVDRRGNNRVWKVVKNKDGQDGQAYKFTLNIRVVGKDAYGDDVTSCSVFASEEPARQEEKPLTPAQRYGLESLEAALQAEGKASVHVDVWRDHFYEKSTADKGSAKRVAFHRARKDLVEIGKIAVLNDFYSLAEQSVTRELLRNIGVTCNGGMEPLERNKRYIPPKGGVTICNASDAGVVA